MILIGQYDSPYVRRVGVTLRLYGLAYEHRPWSVWGDADRIAEYNPLRRVPTLVLDDGVVLVETFAIVDALDELVGPNRALVARSGLERRETLRVVALASGLADKAVSLLYEGLFRPSQSAAWVERCRRQIADTLSALERERARRSTAYWFGPDLSHADVALACCLRFTREAHPPLCDAGTYPELCALAERCERLEPFQAVVQPITNVL